MYNIYFVLHSLNRGGCENVISMIANGLNKNKFNVIIITIKPVLMFNLDNRIRFIPIKHLKISDIFMFIRSKNKIIFSSIFKINLIVGILARLNKVINNKSTLFILRETSIPSIYLKKKSILYSFFLKLIYPSFDLIIAQGESMKKDLVKNFGIVPRKIKIINNPVEDFVNKGNSILKSEKYRLITVGNLTSIKGYDRLLKVIKLLKEKIQFEYYILGTGDQEELIKATIKDYEVQDICILTGGVTNVQDYLINADLFLQGSYYEGFPNVLIEANQVGLPVVAFDVPGGTKEIITNEKNGFLIEDGNIDSFVEHIIIALNTSYDKNDIIKQTQLKFSKAKIIVEYENLFIKMIQNNKNEE